MSIRDPYTKLVLIAGIFIFVCAILAAAAFAATPAFTAHKNGTNQTIVGDTDTLLTWSTEGFDTNNNFATNRFTPTVAGKYLIVVSVHCQQAGYCMPAIRKNGTTIIARAQVMERTVGQTPSVTAIVDMNGTTDYVEALATSSGTVIAGTIERTYFSGSQIDGGGGGGGGKFVDGTNTADAVYTSGNVGVGITNPNALLAVSATGAVLGGTAASTTLRTRAPDLGLSVNDEVALASFGFHSGNNSSLGIRAVRTSATGGWTTTAIGLGMDVDNSVRAGGASIWIHANGNVGIGTTNPQAKLQVVGSGEITGAVPFNTNHEYLRMRGSDYGANKPYMFVKTDGASGWNIGLWDGDDHGGTQLSFYAGNYAFVGGNVGIGTTTPASKLHVAGGIQLADDTATCPGASNVKLGTLRFNTGVLQVCLSSGWSDIGASGSATMYPNFPDAILCTTSGELRYLTLHFVDGGLVDYRQPSAGANDGVKYNATTGAYASQSGMGSSDCVTGTKSIATLYAEGKAFNYLGTASGATQWTTAGSNIHYTAGNVGIGTTAPTSKLHIVGGSITIDGLSVPLVMGESDLAPNTPGKFWRMPLDGGTLRFDVDTQGDGDYSPLVSPLAMLPSGNVGIGTLGPSYKLHVNGQVAGTAAYVNTSDARLKTDVADLTDGLDTVMRLRPVTFLWKQQKEDWQKGRKLGLVAQEAEKVLPEIVSTADDAMHIKSIAYGDLTPVLIKAVQELKSTNDNMSANQIALQKELRQTIESQDAELDRLRRKIEALEARQ